MTILNSSRQLELRAGDRVCCLYESPEEEAALLPVLILPALERGEKVIYLAERSSDNAVADLLRSHSPVLDDHLGSGRLRFHPVSNLLFHFGRFDPARAVDRLLTLAREAQAEGHAGLRIITEMNWLQRDSRAADRLPEYEARLAALTVEVPCVVIGQYQTAGFTPAALWKILCSHPRVIARSTLCENFYYLPMEDWENPVKTAPNITRCLINLIARHTVEGNLRQAKEFAERLIETANVMVVGLDHEGRVEIFNDSAEETTGYSKAEIAGKNWFDFMVPRQEYRDVVKVFRSFESGSSSKHQVYESPIITRSGKERLISWRNSRVERDGRFAGTISFGLDVTERKRTEEKLQLSDQVLRNVGALVLVGDANAQLTYVGPSARHVLGYEPEELLGDGWWKMTRDDPAEREREKAAVMELCRRGPGFSSDPYERLIKHRDGRPRWIEWQDTVSPDGLIIGVGHDITLRRKAEEQLQRVMLAVEQSPSSVVITDLNGNIEYVNPKFSEVTGYAREEVLGQNPRLLRSGEMNAQEYRLLWDTILSGKEWRGEFHNRRKNGELFWEMASISPVKNARAEITHFVAIKEDITQRKSLEQQLRQSQKMEAVGTLAGGIAHDFNNLLTAINGYSELALASLPPDSPLRPTLQEIKRAGERAAALTRQLLAFSRKQWLQPQVLDLNAVVRGIDDMLRRLLGEDVELVMNLHPRLAETKADPGQIEQVIVNLAVNARDAMPRGGQLTVETANIEMTRSLLRRHPGMPPGSYVMLAISDTGCGMTPEVQAHIFEPFFTTKEVGKGTGLGLSTAYGIVKQSGGFIYFSSAVNQGATFRVYFPNVKHPAAKVSA